MFAITKKYTDYNGMERTETFRFNFTPAEVTMRQYSVDGGYKAMMERIIATKDQTKLIQEFKKLVIESYGVKSDDGRRFMKNDELRAEFEECPAYSMIFMELATDDKKASNFVNHVFPTKEEMDKYAAETGTTPVSPAITPVG